MFLLFVCTNRPFYYFCLFTLQPVSYNQVTPSFWLCICVNFRLCCTHFSCRWRKIHIVLRWLMQISNRQCNPWSTPHSHPPFLFANNLDPCTHMILTFPFRLFLVRRHCWGWQRTCDQLGAGRLNDTHKHTICDWILHQGPLVQQ